MMKPDNYMQVMIDAVTDSGRNLTPWEEDFMESITDQYERAGSLSDRQEEILQQIFSEKTR